jgi:hypothetical protein
VRAWGPCACTTTATAATPHNPGAKRPTPPATTQRCARHQGTHEDGATGLNLLELVDRRASDVAVGVVEGGEILQLLANDEAQRSQHGDAAVHELALAPAAHVLHARTLGKVEGVEHVGEGLGDARQRLGVCVERVAVRAQHTHAGQRQHRPGGCACVPGARIKTVDACCWPAAPARAQHVSMHALSCWGPLPEPAAAGWPNAGCRSAGGVAREASAVACTAPLPPPLPSTPQRHSHS